MSTNTCNAVMTPKLFTHCSYYAQNTNAGTSSMPDPLYLCDIRAVPKPPIDIYSDSCCHGGFGGLFGGLYGIGPQSWMAADSTMSYNIWADGTSSNNMWKAIGHQMIGAFGNNLVGATSMLTSPQTLLSFGGAAAGGAASIFSNLGKMCS